jgi:hypothetical protein
MSAQHLAWMAGLCLSLALVACSRPDSVFSLPPTFSAHSDLGQTPLAECIASRWKNGTRDFSRTRKNGAIRLRGETFFSGVTIGVRLRSDAGKTLVEYFERRFADPLYVGMVRGCLHPAPAATP